MQFFERMELFVNDNLKRHAELTEKIKLEVRHDHCNICINFFVNTRLKKLVKDNWQLYEGLCLQLQMQKQLWMVSLFCSICLYNTHTHSLSLSLSLLFLSRYISTCFVHAYSIITSCHLQSSSTQLLPPTRITEQSCQSTSSNL